jgi:hypothetical protein
MSFCSPYLSTSFAIYLKYRCPIKMNDHLRPTEVWNSALLRRMRHRFWSFVILESMWELVSLRIQTNYQRNTRRTRGLEAFNWSEVVGLLKFAQLQMCVLIYIQGEKLIRRPHQLQFLRPWHSFQLLADMHWENSRCQGAILSSKIRSLSWQVHDWQTLREVRLFHEVTVIRYTRKSISNIVQIVFVLAGDSMSGLAIWKLPTTWHLLIMTLTSDLHFITNPGFSGSSAKRFIEVTCTHS